MLVGAVAIAFSGILFRLAHVSASTGAFYRCVWALPPLWRARADRGSPLRPARAAARSRSRGWPARSSPPISSSGTTRSSRSAPVSRRCSATRRSCSSDCSRGLLLGERPDRSSLAAIPIVGVGVVLISGALEQGAYGSNPQLGAVYGVLTGIAYSGFLLALRQGSRRPAPAWRGRSSPRRCPRRSVARRSALVDRRPRSDAVLVGDGLAGPARTLVAGRSAGC